MKLITTLLILSANYVFAQNEYQILVSGRTSNSVKEYDINGNYIGDFVNPNDGGLAQTEDILFHPDGSVLVSGFGNTAIKRYDGNSGSYLGDFSSGYVLSQPSKMTIGPDSLIYITQWAGDSSVVRFDLNGNFVDQFTGPLNSALMHLWDADTNFYVTEFGSGTDGIVHKFDKDGNDLGTFINSVILQGPTGMWTDATGDFFVQDWTTGRVEQYDSLGVYEGVFISSMSQPEGITFLPNGDMLMGDWGSDLVHRFDSLGNNQSVFTVGNGLGDPNAVKSRPHPSASFSEQSSVDITAYYQIGDHIIVVETTAATKDDSFSLFTLDGKEVEIQFTNSGFEEHQYNLRIIGAVSDGIYLLKMELSDQTLTEKILIKV